MPNDKCLLISLKINNFICRVEGSNLIDKFIETIEKEGLQAKLHLVIVIDHNNVNWMNELFKRVTNFVRLTVKTYE